MTEMSKAETRRFIMQGTFTGKLATVKKDGFSCRSTTSSKAGVGDIIFTTGSESIKAKNIHPNKLVSICIDDQIPPLFLVPQKIFPYRQKEVLKWATKIAEPYMGKRNVKRYGRTNSGEVLVRIKPTRILAENDTAVLN